MSDFAISSLRLNNFRGYKDKMIEFSPEINILYGDNAVGKTSILEAVAYLGLSKSFRGAKDKEILKFGEEYFFVKGSFIEKDNKKSEVIISFKEKDKKIKKNNYIYQKISDYIGYFNVVSFEPSDLNLIKGGPSERRRFLDVNISQYDTEYLISIVKYNKILKKRNDFLKSIEELNEKSNQYLDAIDELLASEAIKLIKTRESFIISINEYIEKVSKSISTNNEVVSIVYNKSENVENFVNNLKRKRKYDFICKSTSLGPHRDDLTIKINSCEAEKYASQGQIRTAVIALKLGLASFLKESNAKQIVLLDDVFSELDHNRQCELLNSLKGKTQVFITTTSITNITQDILAKSKLIKVEKEIKA